MLYIYSFNFDIKSATLFALVTLPSRTSFTARDNVPLRFLGIVAIVTPLRLLNILRNPGNILWSSRSN